MKKWTDEVWQRALPEYERILKLPFIVELADGTLSEERFARYLAQDELYVASYGVLMKRVAEMLPDAADREFMSAFALSGVESEKAMHDLLISRFGVETAVEPSDVTLGYLDLLRRAVDSGDACVAFAALLPCSWVYNRVGLHIFGSARLEGNVYREWITEYGNADFSATIERLLDIADRLAESASPAVREAMSEAFLNACVYEYDFWDYGYKGKS